MKRRPRKVFGRRWVKIDGAKFIIEMRKDSVAVRELRSRREHSLKLGEVVDAACGQSFIRIMR